MSMTALSEYLLFHITSDKNAILHWHARSHESLVIEKILIPSMCFLLNSSETLQKHCVKVMNLIHFKKEKIISSNSIFILHFICGDSGPDLEKYLSDAFSFELVPQI